MRTVVGGVGELYQGDLDLGRRVVERLAAFDWGPDVALEDFHYGAVAVAQRLDELRPDVLVLAGAAVRGRAPGTVERRRVQAAAIDAARAQGAIESAVTGYVGIDLVVEVAHALGVLPSRTVAIEVEPARSEPGEELSPEGVAALERLTERVRAEVERSPLFELCEQLRERRKDDCLEPSPALSVLDELLAELERVEEAGRWGVAFARRDELRLRMSQGETGEGMDQLDWTLWWSLIEELDRLQGGDAVDHRI